MDDVQQPARPQPNFPAMTQHLAAFIDEFQHCMNIPAVEGGVAIAEALGSINRAMVELRQEVRNGFQRIETRFTRLEAMIAAEFVLPAKAGSMCVLLTSLSHNTGSQIRSLGS